LNIDQEGDRNGVCDLEGGIIEDTVPGRALEGGTIDEAVPARGLAGGITIEAVVPGRDRERGTVEAAVTGVRDLDGVTMEEDIPVVSIDKGVNTPSSRLLLSARESVGVDIASRAFTAAGTRTWVRTPLPRVPDASEGARVRA